MDIPICKRWRPKERQFNRIAQARYRDASVRPTLLHHVDALGNGRGAPWSSARHFVQWWPSQGCVDWRAAAAEIQLVDDDFSMALVWLISDARVCPAERPIQNGNLTFHPAAGSQHTGGNLEHPLHRQLQPAQRLFGTSDRGTISVRSQEGFFLKLHGNAKPAP